MRIFAGLAAMVVIGSAPAAATDWPDRVRATYEINFNGFDLGTFVFDARVQSGEYLLRGKASLSAVFGAFSWDGRLRSQGRVGGIRPVPAVYRFRFRSSSKDGRIDMKFTSGAVTNVAAKPRIKPSRKRVEVTDSHLRDVFDPLSAIMALTASKHRNIAKVNPCDRSLPVFDGKQRFDLKLSYKGKARIKNREARGLAKFAYVCRVRYVPVAGHKMNEETRFMASNKGIEIWLVPAPKPAIFVPYKIVIPTQYGTAYLNSRRVDVIGRGRVALVN